MNPMLALKLIGSAKSVFSWLQKNEVKPLKVFEKGDFSEKSKLYVYTFQCGFKTKEELNTFMKIQELANKIQEVFEKES